MHKSNETLEGLIEFSKYLFGYNIHRSYKKKRQEIRKTEDNLTKRTLKLSKNYTYECIRQVVRYAPLAWETTVAYVAIIEDLSAVKYFSLSTMTRAVELMAISAYQVNKFIPKFRKFADDLEKLGKTMNFILYKIDSWKDPYEVLGIDKTNDLDAVQKAYRSIAIECHPDKNNGNPEKTQKFKESAAAYAQLKNNLLGYQPTFKIKTISILPIPVESIS